MIKISNKELREQLKTMGVQFSWLTEKVFISPKLEEIKAILQEASVAALKFIPNIQECDDFALHLHSKIKRIRGDWAATGKILAPEAFNWAFGECFGIKFNGITKSHNVNIAVCEEGIFLLEPQTNETWQFNQNQDTILIVRM